MAVISRRNLTLIQTKTRQALALTTTLLLTVPTFAQQPVPQSDEHDNPPALMEKAANGKDVLITIPAGTRIALVLTQPLQTRYLRRGDDVYAQITSPVASGDEVVIPPGTFVQGKFDRLERKGDRGELRLQSMGITYPDGYVAPVPGPINMESDEGYVEKDPGRGRIAGMVALPAAGAGIGVLVGQSFGHSASIVTTNNCGVNINCLPQSTIIPDTKVRDTGIGAGVGLAVGGIGSLFLLFSSHNFYLDQGSPVQMTLQQPLTLDIDKIAAPAQPTDEDPISKSN